MAWLLGPIGIFIAVCVIAGNQSPSEINMGNHCAKVDDETIECNQNVNINTGAFGGTFSLGGITAIAQGPVLSGTITNLQSVGLPMLNATAQPFEWKLIGNCKTGFKEVLYDPFEVFTQGLTSEMNPGYNYATVTVDPVLNQDYLDEPYPCRVLVQTNGGSRIINLGVATELTTEQINAFNLEAKAKKLACYVAISEFPHTIEFIWLPDPPPEEEIFQLWKVVASDLSRNEKATLYNGYNQQIMSSVPNAYGVVYLSAMFEPGINNEMISISLSHSSLETMRETNRAVKRHVYVKQVALIKKAELPVHGRYKDMRLNMVKSNIYRLELYTSRGKRIFDLSQPEMPFLVHRGSRSRWGFTAFSKGFIEVNELNNEIILTGKHLKRAASIKLENVQQVVSVHNKLLALTESGVVCFDLTDERHPKRTEDFVSMEDKVFHIQNAKVGGTKDVVYIHSEKRGMYLVGFSKPQGSNTMAEYDREPWFVNTACAGKLLAKLSSDGKSISIFEVGKVVEI
jgi:hypothetical protein